MSDRGKEAEGRRETKGEMEKRGEEKREMKGYVGERRRGGRARNLKRELR